MPLECNSCGGLTERLACRVAAPPQIERKAAIRNFEAIAHGAVVAPLLGMVQAAAPAAPASLLPLPACLAACLSAP